MKSAEFKSLPGGRLGVNLFLSGLAVVSGSAILMAKAYGADQTFRIGSDAWILPAWGLGAIGLALALRHGQPRARWLSYGWAVAGSILLLFVVFGTSVAAT